MRARRMSARLLHPRLIAPIAALALLGAAPAPASVSRVVDGYIVTQHITTEGTPSVSLTMRIKVATGKVRIELDSPELAQMGGMYMLTRDDGKVTAVMASQGMAIIMDPAMVTGGRGMAGFTPPVITDLSMTVDDLGPGDRILGYATHKYRMHATYKMAMGGAAPSSYESTIESSSATDVPALADGLQKFADSFGSAFSGVAGGGSKDIAAQMKAKMPKGYTLKAVIKSSETSSTGQVTPSTTTIEVTDIAKATIDAAEFEVPAGIQVMDMAQMMGGRGGH